MAEVLSDDDRASAIRGLDGWAEADGGKAITREFEFADFVEAFGFMAKAAIHAEKMNHHPEWSNVYKTVDVTLSTHSAGGVTDLDIMLARTMDRLA